jgi:predicted DNA-binding transcriptional regulator AlpA
MPPSQLLSPSESSRLRIIADIIAKLLLEMVVQDRRMIGDAPVSSFNGKTPDHQLLTLKQVMELVPVSRATLHRMEKDGRFPAPKRMGQGRRAWRARDIYNWIDEDRTGQQRRNRGGATKKNVTAKKRVPKKK